MRTDPAEGWVPELLEILDPTSKATFVADQSSSTADIEWVRSTGDLHVVEVTMATPFIARSAADYLKTHADPSRERCARSWWIQPVATAKLKAVTSKIDALLAEAERVGRATITEDDDIFGDQLRKLGVRHAVAVDERDRHVLMMPGPGVVDVEFAEAHRAALAAASKQDNIRKLTRNDAVETHLLVTVDNYLTGPYLAMWQRAETCRDYIPIFDRAITQLWLVARWGNQCRCFRALNGVAWKRVQI